MNYTENYHLPQWDEHDRIMRSDFNQMCADIEAGLAGNARTATGLQQSSAVQEKRTLSRLCRVAYNHYRAVQSMNPMPQQIGVLRKTAEESNITGTKVINEIHSAGKDSVTMTKELFEANFKQLTALNVVKGNLAASTPLTADFTPPASGQVNIFILWGDFYNNVPNTQAMFRVMLTNRDTGSVDFFKDVNLSQTQTSAHLINYYIRVPFAFLGNVHYLLTIQPLEAVYDLTANFALGEQGRVTALSTEGEVTASCTLREPEGGEGGMVLLHCAENGAGGTLTLEWDGKVRQPSTVRTVPLDGGQSAREYVYLREDIIPQESSLKLRYSCKEGGSFQFFDWGAVMF